MIKDDNTNFFYSALLVIGGLFAVFNIRIGIRNFKAQNRDYPTLLKENAMLKKRIAELEKLIL